MAENGVIIVKLKIIKIIVFKDTLFGVFGSNFYIFITMNNLAMWRCSSVVKRLFRMWKTSNSNPYISTIFPVVFCIKKKTL